MNALAHIPSKATAYLTQRRSSAVTARASPSLPRRSALLSPLASSFSTSSQGTTRAAAAGGGSSSSRLLSSPASRATASLRRKAAALHRRSNKSRKNSSFAPRAAGGGDDRSDAPLERALAAAPYLFPLLDGLRYGRFLFRYEERQKGARSKKEVKRELKPPSKRKTHCFPTFSGSKSKKKTANIRQYPITQAIVSPLAPLAQIYYTVPFASLVLFFAIYLGLVQQTDRWSRFVRFNAMQAILLDILLIVPGVIESVFKAPTNGAGLQIYMSLYNTVWLFCLASFVAGVFGTLILGKTVRLPLVGEAADQQVRF